MLQSDWAQGPEHRSSKRGVQRCGRKCMLHLGPVHVSGGETASPGANALFGATPRPSSSRVLSRPGTGVLHGKGPGQERFWQHLGGAETLPNHVAGLILHQPEPASPGSSLSTACLAPSAMQPRPACHGGTGASLFTCAWSLLTTCEHRSEQDGPGLGLARSSAGSKMGQGRTVVDLASKRLKLFAS